MTVDLLDDIIWIEGARMPWFDTRLGHLKKEKIHVLYMLYIYDILYIYSIYLIYYIYIYLIFYLYIVYILYVYYISYILHIYVRSKVCDI